MLLSNAERRHFPILSSVWTLTDWHVQQRAWTPSQSSMSKSEVWSSQPRLNSENFLIELCTCNNSLHRPHWPTNQWVWTMILRTSPPRGTRTSPPPMTPWRTSHLLKDSPQGWETPETLWTASPRHGMTVTVRTSVIYLNQVKSGQISHRLLQCSRIRVSMYPRSRHSPVTTWQLTRSLATGRTTGWATRTHSRTDKLTQTPQSILSTRCPVKLRFTCVTGRCGSNSTDTKQKWSLLNRDGKSNFFYLSFNLIG